MREAHMMPMLTSMADHVTAWMPDSTTVLVVDCEIAQGEVLLTNKPAAPLQKIDGGESHHAHNADKETQDEHEYEIYFLLAR